MSRRVRCLVATATIGVALMVAGPARACTTLDLGCSTDALTDGVRDAVDGGTDVAGGALEPVGDPLEEVVDDTVDGASGLIDGVVGGTPDLPVDPGDTEPPDDGGPGGDGGPSDPRDDRGPARPDRGTSGGVTAVEAASARAARASVAPPTIAIGTATMAQRQSPGHDPSGGVRGVLLAAVPSLGVLAALFGLALTFVSIQAAIDRRDPRLAAVRASDEIVRFR